MGEQFKIISSGTSTRQMSTSVSKGLNPNFITGFTDGDGSFSVVISKNNNDTGAPYKIQPVYTIGLHIKDKALLEEIKEFFNGKGNIFVRKDGLKVDYTVGSTKDLVNYILPHFDAYPLVSQKRADYLLFKEIVLLLNNKEHLSEEGLLKVIALKASLNKGLPESLAEVFSDVKPVTRPEVKLVDELHPN